VRLERIAARAGDFDFVVIGVNVGFHLVFLRVDSRRLNMNDAMSVTDSRKSYILLVFPTDCNPRHMEGCN
jgi:hypothetical protein